MCRETMDIKKDALKSDCLRRIVSPGGRFGLRLFRHSVRRDEALRGVVKSTIRKYLHREKKRAHFAKLAQNATETARTKGEETHRIRGEESGAAALLLLLPPPGAMAPANTTQYLMGQFYEDSQQNDNITSLQSEELGSQQEIDTIDSYDACLSFQQRDFDAQFATLW